MKINQIWEQLEADQSFSHGLLLRRYAGSILPDVFVALKAPEKIRCIAASVNRKIRLSTDQYSNLRDISVVVLPDNSNTERQMILFELLNAQHNDIFSILCEDLMASIENVNTDTALIKELFNRFEKWKSLFEIAWSPGLDSEEQRGIFGELYLLKKLLETKHDAVTVISSWVGCEKQIRDFQLKDWSIEVKTTHGNNHQRLHIHNERQLDCSQLSLLYLFHLSIEARQKAGTTLNDLVSGIRHLLQHDFRALNKLNAKLMEGGYFDHHATNYNDPGYFIRQEIFYRVHNDFPRIEERDIRNGIGDVNYSIIVSQASEYIQPEMQVLESLNFDE